MARGWAKAAGGGGGVQQIHADKKELQFITKQKNWNKKYDKKIYTKIVFKKCTQQILPTQLLK